MKKIMVALIALVTLVYADFSSRNGVVTDNKTGLQWQDNYSDNNAIIKDANWIESINYCAKLSLNSKDDWRLPNKKELSSIVDYSRIRPAINPIFQNTILDGYWCSTTHPYYTAEAWVTHFTIGVMLYIHKSNNLNVRCVRDANPAIDTTKLYWPIDCLPGNDCSLGHADVDNDDLAFDCSEPGYTGHEGTDISISWEQMDKGVDVYAAQSGTVLWVFDDPNAFDRCISSDTHFDCTQPVSELKPNLNEGHTVCTESGNYCQGGGGDCFWCFSGKNVIVIKHDTGSVFATRYDHLKSGSTLVKKGDYVVRGQKIAEVGSAGSSTGPHLHFEVWGSDYYSPSEPFSGKCGPNFSESLWNNQNKPWEVSTSSSL